MSEVEGKLDFNTREKIQIFFLLKNFSTTVQTNEFKHRILRGFRTMFFSVIN